MAITSILGGGQERGINSSPRMSSSAMSSGNERSINSSPRIPGFGQPGGLQAMRPPSPARARASSMREVPGRREQSPPRGGFLGEPRAQSAFHERSGPDARRELFASPQLQRESPHSFRAFKPEQQELRQGCKRRCHPGPAEQPAGGTCGAPAMSKTSLQDGRLRLMGDTVGSVNSASQYGPRGYRATMPTRSQMA